MIKFKLEKKLTRKLFFQELKSSCNEARIYNVNMTLKSAWSLEPFETLLEMYFKTQSCPALYFSNDNMKFVTHRILGGCNQNLFLEETGCTVYEYIT